MQIFLLLEFLVQRILILNPGGLVVEESFFLFASSFLGFVVSDLLRFEFCYVGNRGLFEYGKEGRRLEKGHQEVDSEEAEWVYLSNDKEAIMSNDKDDKEEQAKLMRCFGRTLSLILPLSKCDRSPH